MSRRARVFWIAVLVPMAMLCFIFGVGYSGNDISKECRATGSFKHIEHDHEVLYICAKGKHK
jgi:hypothetical protein